MIKEWREYKFGKEEGRKENRRVQYEENVKNENTSRSMEQSADERCLRIRNNGAARSTEILCSRTADY